MAKFRKRPVVIEAMQIPLDQALGSLEAWGRLASWLGPDGPWKMTGDGGVNLKTLEGTMRGDPGDWIIRGIKNELYPCEPDIFAATYELVE